MEAADSVVVCIMSMFVWKSAMHAGYNTKNGDLLLGSSFEHACLVVFLCLQK